MIGTCDSEGSARRGCCLEHHHRHHVVHQDEAGRSSCASSTPTAVVGLEIRSQGAQHVDEQLRSPHVSPPEALAPLRSRSQFVAGAARRGLDERHGKSKEKVLKRSGSLALDVHPQAHGCVMASRGRCRHAAASVTTDGRVERPLSWYASGRRRCPRLRSERARRSSLAPGCTRRPGVRRR